ncbi:MAG: thrombospondin type 3 repeat-containing protein [Pseudomonadota bacterium]
MIAAKRGYSALALALASLAWAPTARAEREFPVIIQSDLALSYEVPCSVCHLKENTGAATARTPFALALKARDFTDGQSLGTALARLKSDDFDTDGDGVSDVAELKAGTDPNSAADASLIDAQEPGYGCGGSAPHGRSSGQAALGVAALAWLLTRRLRGRS